MVFSSIPVNCISEEKSPVGLPEMDAPVGVITALLSIMLLGLLGSEISGFSGSLKSIIPLPNDSNEFSMPSLSQSKSMVSGMPSLSKSLGHKLTVM